MFEMHSTFCMHVFMLNTQKGLKNSESKLQNKDRKLKILIDSIQDEIIKSIELSHDMDGSKKWCN